MSKAHPVLVLAALALPGVAAGQIGYPPGGSPYHAITARSGIVALGGYVGGDPGKVGVGPSDGPLAGLGYEMRLTGPTDLRIAVAWGSLQRMLADPKAPADSQLSGPVRQSVIFAEAGLSVLLTGDKTWKGLAPYLGATLGMAFGSSNPADSVSGYNFGAKFMSGPHLGLRFYTGQTLSLRVEGQLLFWRLHYPTSYFLPPERAPGDPPVLDPAVNSETDWTTHPTILFGLGLAFRL